MKKKLFFVVVVLAVAGLVAVYFASQRTYPTPSLRTTGIVEGVEVNIAATIPGRIIKECCREGDAVAQGATVVELESDEIKASVQQAVAGAERAKAEVLAAESAIAGSRANIASAEAAIKSAEADVAKAQAQLDEAAREKERSTALFNRGILAKQSLDTAVTAYDTAAANTQSAKARLTAAVSGKAAASSQLSLSENQRSSAQAGVRQAEANVAYSQATLAKTMIASPITGVVVYKALETGETVVPGATILTIVDLNSLYIRVDLEENLIGSIRLNGEAIIRADSAPNREIKGKISEIGREAEFATQKDVTRGRQDIQTFKVKIAFTDPSGFLKPGMTVEVEMPKKDMK